MICVKSMNTSVEPSKAYVPFLQVLHSCWPVWLVKVPIGQCRHELKLPVAKVPASHVVHAEVPVLFANVPTGQAVQDDALGRENWAMGQAWQNVCAVSENVPA